MLADFTRESFAVVSSLLLVGCGAGGAPLGGYGGKQNFDHFVDREWFQQSVSEYERCVAGTPGGVGGKYEKAPDCWVFVLNKARVAKENSKWGGESDGAPGLGGGSAGGNGMGGSGCNSFAASEGSVAGGGQASAESGNESSGAGGGNSDAASGGESSSAGGGNASASC